MRIGIDARMYGPEATTGIGTYIKGLTDNLFLIDQKNEYILFMLKPAFSKFIPPNIRVKKIKVNCPWYSWSEQIEMPKILLKNKLDLVHFPHFNVPILYPKKFVVTVHDVTPKFFPGPHVKKSFVRKIGYNLVFTLGTKRAKKIITISNYTKDNLVKYFGIKPEKIDVNYLGIGQEFKIIQDLAILQTVKKKYSITKPFIFYVGVWRDHKNLTGLIKAFEILKSKHQLDYQLVMGGKADLKYPEIIQAINDSEFKNDIMTPGFIPDSDLPALYNACQLFVLPSYCEGFGLVAVEAMACGVPVVASNTTSLPEILEDAALYFDPHKKEEMAEQINKILTNPQPYQDLKTRGLNQIQKYSWPNCAQKTLAVYQNC